MPNLAKEMREQLIELLPRLRRFARTLTRHGADADDILQMALEKALQRHTQWDPSSRLDSWMFSIIRNGWIDELRARQRRGNSVDIEDVDASFARDENSAQIALMSVQQAMAHLPEDQRTAVSLVLVEGLSYKEAAAVMNVPMGTLTSRLARGRETLQKLLHTDEALP